MEDLTALAQLHSHNQEAHMWLPMDLGTRLQNFWYLWYNQRSDQSLHLLPFFYHPGFQRRLRFDRSASDGRAAEFDAYK